MDGFHSSLVRLPSPLRYAVSRSRPALDPCPARIRRLAAALDREGEGALAAAARRAALELEAAAPSKVAEFGAGPASALWR